MRVTRESVNNAKVLYRLSFDRSEVERAQEIYFLSSKLQQVMNNPTIPYEKKADILEKIFSKAGISEKLVKFFQVMCKHNESCEMKDIFKEYYLYSDKMKKIIRAQFFCTSSVTAKKEEKAKELLSEKYIGYTIDWKKTVDDTLLGGYIVKVGNIEYDKSYRNRLRQLEEKLTGR